MKIYTFGPMTPTRFDQEPSDHTYPAFHDAQERLEAAGHVVYNPATNMRGGVWDDSYQPLTAEEWSALGPEEYTKQYVLVMERDVRWILEVDAGAALPGWRKSQGAMFEHSLLCFLHRRISNVQEFVDDPDVAVMEARKAIREYNEPPGEEARIESGTRPTIRMATYRGEVLKDRGVDIGDGNAFYRLNALAHVKQELRRVDKLWGVQNHHPYQWHAILAEECGEVAKVLADARVEDFNRDKYEEELVQSAAMAIRSLETSEKERRGVIDTYAFDGDKC